MINLCIWELIKEDDFLKRKGSLSSSERLELENPAAYLMELGDCILRLWWLSCLGKGGDFYGQSRFSSGRPGKRACGLRKGLAGALPEVKGLI